MGKEQHDETGQQQNGAERPEPSPDKMAPIHLNELSRAEATAARLTAAGLELVQHVLDRLAGRRAASPAEGKEIADRVRGLAKQFGRKLYYNNQPTYFKWGGADFKATTTDSTHTYLGGGVEFPQLTVEKAESEPSGTSTESPDGTHVARTKKSRTTPKHRPR